MRPFVVTAGTPAGVLSLRRDSAEAALSVARRLKTQGMNEILVTTPEGRIQSVSEFARFTTKHRSTGSH
jgi:hypothetical protein